MRLKVEYKSKEEKALLMESHKNLILIEEHNVLEGTFLVFSDVIPEPPIVYISVSEQEFTSLKERQDATDNMVLQLIMEGGVI